MNNLKILRMSKGLTQKEIAEELGISHASWNRFELGKREPSLELTKKIADYFDVSIEKLFFKEIDKTEIVFK